MVDLSKYTKAKSDQLNADDLIGGAITVTITRVNEVSGDQPVAINYEGDNNKPWKPCKTTMRIMQHAWGNDANQFVGRRLTLYRDPAVKWAGVEVGGIRISHMSHIPETLSLTVAENSKKKTAVVVQPLPDAPPAGQPAKQHTPEQKAAAAEKKAKEIAAAYAKADSAAAVTAIGESYAEIIGKLEANYADAFAIVATARNAAENTHPSEDAGADLLNADAAPAATPAPNEEVQL